MTFKKHLLVVACGTAGALFGAAPQIGFAQAGALPLTRAQVIAETRAAERAGLLTPAGEAIGPPTPQEKSTTTRVEVKAELGLARAAGQLVPPVGDGGNLDVGWIELGRRSTRTRGEREAETRAAARAHELIPAGQGPDTPR